MGDDLILVNGIRTPDGTEIFSRSRHSYVTHNDANGKQYMVDGGLDYLRRSANGDEVDISKFYKPGKENHMHNRQCAHWGTYGKDGRQPLVFKPVADMDTDHLEAVVGGCAVKEVLRIIMEQELEYRRGMEGVDAE